LSEKSDHSPSHRISDRHDNDDKNKLSYIIPLGVTAGILFILSVLMAIFTPTKFITTLLLAGAFFLYFIIPGYSLLLFLKLSHLERILLGVGVSAAIVPTLLYIVNLFNILNTKAVIIAICILLSMACWIVFWVRKD
jgi:uncharacterized membrane protein